ncbi:MAG: adenosylcobinamide-GDP ribazoletransferase [Victivallales bacterium]|nr:adenosylcobinamide-GDP ribazoletransferase [Victivallales bacterium]
MKFISPIFLAISMLTRLPLHIDAPSDDDWRRISAAFPLAGYVVGFACVIPAMILVSANIAITARLPEYHTLNSMAIAVISSVSFVAISAWMTRMFHLDGFCDACDAFSAVTDSPARRLEIMKDPHTGAGAVCASAILLITKTSFIFLLVARSSVSDGSFEIFALRTVPLLVAVPVAARFAMTLLAWTGKYPREKGTGQKVVEGASFAATVFAAATLLPLAFFLSLPSMIAIFAVAILATAHWKRKADKLLGGVTGDILGACCETAECAIALALILTM